MQKEKKSLIQSIDKKKKVIIILTVMIVAQLVCITYVFGWKREGFHSDENWQYGFANAYYEHQIYVDDDGNIKNFNEWKDGQVFRNYLEVQKGQQFNFDSVLYNMSVDMSPPLSSLLLHAVCSLFPDTFSWWYAYAINVIFYIIAMISLYFLGKEITHSRKKALLICLWYGFVSAAVNCFVYLRMYSMITAFSILFTYFYCRAYNKKFCGVIPEYIAIAVITFLGGMTHYYFYVFAFFMTGAFVIFQFLKKNWKMAVVNSLLQLGAVGMAFLVWPVTVGRAQGGASFYTAKMPYMFDLDTAIRSITGETIGFAVGLPNIVTWTYMWIGAIFLVILFCGFSFIFRHEKRYWDLWKKIGRGIVTFFKHLPHNFWKMNKLVFLIIIAVDASVLVIVRYSDLFHMGEYGDRYFFYLMPLLIAVAVYVMDHILVHVLKGRGKKYQTKAICLIVLLCIIANQIWFPCNYLFPTDSDISLSELTSDSDVIMILNDKWQLVPFSSSVCNCNQFLALKVESIMEEESLGLIEHMPDTEKEVYLLLETNYLMPEGDEYKMFGAIMDEEMMKSNFYDYSESEVIEKIVDLETVKSLELVGTTRVFRRDVSVYHIEK